MQINNKPHVEMRNSEQLKAEIEVKIGFFPPFFEPALQNPPVLEHLWQQTPMAYINNPLSATFKEKLSAYLSRFCTVPYCMVCHSCTLRPLGMKSGEVLQLLESSPPAVEDVESHLKMLAAHQDSLAVLSKLDSALEESILACAIFIFLEGEAAGKYRNELRNILGGVNYQHLIAFVAYIKTCHVWMEAHPEVSYEADQRVQKHLNTLISEEPKLADFFDNYTAKVERERQSRIAQQATLAERQRNLEALRESEARYRQLVELSPDAIFIQCEGTIVFINSAGVKLLGADTPEQLIGMQIYALIHPASRQLVKQRVNLLLAGIAVPLVEEQFVRLDGSVVDVEVAAFAFHYCGKPAAQVIVRDIGMRKQAEQERTELLAREQAAREEAEHANRSKDEFLAIVSHELRSPLNAMLGWARLLRTRKFDATTMDRALEIIERNALAQSQLLEDLLDISRIIRGKIYLNTHPVALNAIVTAAIDTVQLAADTKSIRLEFITDEAPNPRQIVVLGDSHRLQQVVWNLLSNAIKFTPVGGCVSVQLQKVGASAQITVRDTGKGISAEFLPFVFERFCQADSNSKQHGGLGLGLAIVRQLVELHHGTIHATSRGEGLGATFSVELPLLAAEEPVNDGQSDVSLTTTLAGLRVLVVDDEADVRDYVAVVLEEHGAEVYAIASATTALVAITQFKPDVLVSDIAMPHEDGYSLIQKIRALAPEAGGNIPAAALSAYAREEDRQRALAAGFQLHVSKPIEPTQLANVVAELAGRSGS